MASSLDAHALRTAFEVAAEWLARNRDAVNAINVYPVPDGDTGTNMLLTLRAALDAANEAQPDTAPGDNVPMTAWADALAHGALLGARGNSGVILSQMLRGLATSLGDQPSLDGADLAQALIAASDAAYAALTEPVEGTMLTVLREAAEAARAMSRLSAATPLVVLTVACTEAAVSVLRTPGLLPQLREAGVVDAGGLGVAVILEGLRRSLAGEPLSAAPPMHEDAVALRAVPHEGHGYCVEYLVDADAGADSAPLDREALLAALTALRGESLLVVGDAQTLRVHVHIADPEPAITAGRARGVVGALKTENMQAQHDAWRAAQTASHGTPPASLGLVAVAAGPGIAAAFHALGATVVECPNDTKPSAGELIAAIHATGAAHVLLLPNDKDVLLTAQQAAEADPGRVTVIPSRSVAAGMSAALAFTSVGDAAQVAAAMSAAGAAVRTVEVTRAARAATIDGITVKTGDAIALVDGVLAVRADDLETALVDGIRVAAPINAEIVTVYLGVGSPIDAADRVFAITEAALPNLIVEVLEGGQLHYPFIAGVE